MTYYQVIVNPTAGHGVAGRHIPLIEKTMKTLGLTYGLVQTRSPGHAIELAHQAGENPDTIMVAAGGDGTANEVINGLMLTQKNGGAGKSCAMGVLAIGRGNDFAFGMGIPAGVQSGCEVLARNQRRMVDVGLVTGGLFPAGRYFGNGIGIGFDTVVGFEAAKLPLTGLAAYAVAALKTIFVYSKAPIMELEYEISNTGGPTRLTQPFIMVSIMNGRRMGGGFMMAPQGITDDGLLDLCLTGQLTRMGILALIPRFMQGSQAGHPAVQIRQAQRITIRAIEGTLPAYADGETLCEAGQHLVVEILPGRLELVCNKEAGSP